MYLIYNIQPIDFYFRLKDLAFMRKGTSVSKLAEMAGISKSTISNLRHGKINTLAERTLKKLANALDISVEELLNIPQAVPPSRTEPAVVVKIPDRFVRLTDTDGSPVYVLKDAIVTVYGRGANGYTEVIASYDHTVYNCIDVQETAEKIMETL